MNITFTGLNVIKEIADQSTSTLRFNVTAADGTTAFEQWNDFRLGDGPEYRLFVGQEGTGTACSYLSVKSNVFEILRTKKTNV